MKITLMIEGDTEKAFLPHLRNFLQGRLPGRMPRLDPFIYHGPLPKKDKLKRAVKNLLGQGKQPSDYVIALTDVYTGKNEFNSAEDAIQKMRDWVGANDRFFPRAAQHDFEAWLIPYWPRVQDLAGHNMGAPGGKPEQVNLTKPPSQHLKDIFLAGSKGMAYVKPRDANRILDGQDLLVAAKACPQLKSFLNTILKICDGELIH